VWIHCAQGKGLETKRRSDCYENFAAHYVLSGYGRDSRCNISCFCFRTEVQYYVNVERINAGLTPVVLDDSLGRGAVVRATEAQVSFAHQRPDGRDVKSVLENGTCGWFGENLAVSEVKDARRIVRAWMGSPTHRANILGRHYVRMGVECIRNKADGHYYWALLFAGE